MGVVGASFTPKEGGSSGVPSGGRAFETFAIGTAYGLAQYSVGWWAAFTTQNLPEPRNEEEVPGTIAPPPWQAPWAYLLYGIGMVGAAYGALRLRTRRLDDRAAALEAQVELRTNELTALAMELQASEMKSTERARELETVVEMLKESEQEALLAKEAAERAARARSEFLAMMSHEIRTPMNAVIGLASLLLASPLSEAQREQVELLRRSGTSLLGIINDILDYSKIEAGKIEIESIAFDPKRCVADVVELFATIVANKGIALSWSAAGDVPVAVLGDQLRVRQVLINLVANAIKFTDAGSVEVIVSADAEPKLVGAPVELRYDVRDTGIGIPVDRMDRLFDLFSQVDASTTRKYGGTGLGLAISKRLIEAMGGQIRVESVEGRGSVFGFSLVGKVAERDEDPQSRGEEPVGAPSNLRVLVVEDNPVNQLVTLALLELLGLEADMVENGREAVDAVERKTYDVVLMDVHMPEMDGLEATRRIRAASPTGGPTIVAMTASVLAADRKACLDAGMDHFISKPVSRDDLASVLSRRGATEKRQTGNGDVTLPVLDETILVQLERLSAAGGSDRIQPLIDKFVSNAEQHFEEIRARIAAGDADGLREVAHTVKGSGGMLGAKRFASACASLERAAVDGASATWPMLFESVLAEFADVNRAIQEWQGAASRRSQS